MSAESVITAAEHQPNSSPLTVLREHTRDLHTQVEAAIHLDASLHSLNSYQALLGKYLVLYRTFEAELMRRSGLFADLTGYVYQPRVPELERDLASPALASLSQPALLPLPHALPFLPCTDNLDAILGSLYVVEGSSLGGQFIYREVQQKLKLTSVNGAAFFYGNGEHTGVAWKQFTAVLNRHILHPDRAAEAATAMFHAFQQTLQAGPEAHTA